MSATVRGQGTDNIGIAVDQLMLFDLSESMKLWCQQLHVSQSTLAMRVGVSTSHINQIIHGRVRPSAELARRIRTVISGKSRLPDRASPAER